MRFTLPITTLALSTAAIVTAAPTTSTNVEAIYPPGGLNPLLAARDLKVGTQCPASNNCGVVTFKSGQFASFGQGICMQLGSNVQSIYVAECYCSLWS